MTHRWLRLFDAQGNWTGSDDYTITVDGVKHDLFAYAKAHNVKLPIVKPKKQKQVNTNADMEQPLSTGSIEVNGNGDSESTE